MAKSEVILGDCMEYMRTLPDNAFDLAIVDPPYYTQDQMRHEMRGGYMRGKMGSKPCVDYHMELWHQDKPGKEYFDELRRVSRNQIIWGGNHFAAEIGADSMCWIVWDKERPATVTWSQAELAYTSFVKPAAVKLFRYKWNGAQQGPKGSVRETRIHPTQKPVALYEWILTNFAKPGDRILDTHLGSGSSRIAADKLGFDFVGIEIDPTYYEQEEARFREYLEQKAEQARQAEQPAPEPSEKPRQARKTRMPKRLPVSPGYERLKINIW